jgi:RNA polymerase-binding transcription factor DksA
MAQRPDHAQTPSEGADRPTVDLERVTADLEGVEAALHRLDDGTYWTDEATGEPIPDHVLSANPVARRAAPAEGEA